MTLFPNISLDAKVKQWCYVGLYMKVCSDSFSLAIWKLKLDIQTLFLKQFPSSWQPGTKKESSFARSRRKCAFFYNDFFQFHFVEPGPSSRDSRSDKSTELERLKTSLNLKNLLHFLDA